MSEDYLGNVVLVGFNFPPRGYRRCDGALLPIAQFTALFALIGTTYGGNGQTTFGLPDLRGRAAVGPGQGAGLSNVLLGERGGSENVTVLATQMPQHTHALNAQSGLGTTAAPAGTALAQTALDDGTPIRSYSSATPDTALATASIGTTGGSQPLPIRNPYLGMNYVICVEGVFPSRN